MLEIILSSLSLLLLKYLQLTHSHFYEYISACYLRHLKYFRPLELNLQPRMQEISLIPRFRSCRTFRFSSEFPDTNMLADLKEQLAQRDALIRTERFH